MHLHCPHCRNPIEIVAQDPTNEVVCPSCGSSFCLEDGGERPSATTEYHRQLGQFTLVGLARVRLVRWTSESSVFSRRSLRR
jgi:ribosomal protein S27E